MERSFWQKSWIPHLLLMILAASMLYRMLERPYSFCDDLVHYSSLFKYLNGGVALETPGGRVHGIHIVILGDRVIFVALARFFQILGAEYPMLAASKLWALLMLVLGYAAWASYLKKPLGLAACWAALAIVLFNTVNHIIPAGQPRSSVVALLALWCMALRSRSPLAIACVLLLVSVVYPVIMPVLGLSLFFATAWTWRKEKSFGFRFGVLVLGFVTSVSYMVIRSINNFTANAQHPMTYSEMMEVFHSGKFRPNLDIPRLIGRLADQSIIEWIQFNVFYYWNKVSQHFELVIVVCFAALCLLGFFLNIKYFKKQRSWMIFLPALIPLIAGIAAYREGDFFLSVSWTIALASIAWMISPKEETSLSLTPELKLLIPASIAAFIVVHLACYRIFIAVLDPGRQLQKTFLILAPLIAFMYLVRLFESLQWRFKHILAAGLGLFLFISGCSFYNLAYTEYRDEKVMRALKGLPVNAEILCHPKTANFVLIMAGKGASTCTELVRIGAQPYTQDMFDAYARDVGLIYSTGPEKLKSWCSQSPGNRYILVEPEIYGARQVDKLIGPYNKMMEQRRDKGYFLNDLDSPCEEKIGESVSLLPCDCLLGESGAEPSLPKEE